MLRSDKQSRKDVRPTHSFTFQIFICPVSVLLNFHAAVIDSDGAKHAATSFAVSCASWSVDWLFSVALLFHGSHTVCFIYFHLHSRDT